MADRLAVAREAGGSVGQVALVLLLADRQAKIRAVAAAVLALAALRREQRHHAVARGQARDAVAEPLDDSGALVAEDGRRVARWVRAGGGVHVGVADTAGLEPHEHLAAPGLRELDLGDMQRRSELLEHCGSDLHGDESSLQRGRAQRC